MKKMMICTMLAGIVACGDDGGSPSGTKNNTNTGCVVTAGGVEVCDGVDNDCNGTVDDGFDVGQTCEQSEGACTGSGTITCNDDGSAYCKLAGDLVADEICDGVDNDCDGATDEGFDVGELCDIGVGACAVQGTFVCGGDGVVCESTDTAAEPTDEICDGIDNDCDGESDEDFDTLGEECAVGVGACMNTGVLVCAEDGLDVVCDAVAGTPAAAESCNGLDDNCDGESDEGFGIGDECFSGLGVCAVAGSAICNDTQDGVVCDATALTPAVADELTCDNLDNDCDGEADEGCDDDNDGYCDSAFTVVAATTCPNGGNDCNDMVAAINPAAIEVCDTVDNNCNNAVDDQATDATTYYVDCDGDGYAIASALTQRACMQPPAPSAVTSCNGATGANWTTRAPVDQGSIDCHDANALFRPNQTTKFSTGGTPSGNTIAFDFNCDGQVTRLETDLIASPNEPCPTANYDVIFGCGAPPSAATAWLSTTVPGCGQNGFYSVCSNYQKVGINDFCTGTRQTSVEPQTCN